MEEPRAPSPSTQEPLSPPPEAELGESVGSGRADPDSAAAVQLASQASHLTLSTSGIVAEGYGAKPPGMSSSAFRVPYFITASPIMPPTADAQRPPEIAQDRGAREWQKGVAITHGCEFPPGESPPSPSVEGTVGAYTAFNQPVAASTTVVVKQSTVQNKQLLDLPNEVLLQVLSNLEVCDLLATSRVRPVSLSSPRLDLRWPKYPHRFSSLSSQPTQVEVARESITPDHHRPRGAGCLASIVLSLPPLLSSYPSTVSAAARSLPESSIF